jgi:hypothetical protein
MKQKLHYIGAVVFIGAALLILSGVASGATASGLRTLGFGYSDSIYNYDFASQSVSASNVDWAVSLLFRNNSEINKIKNILSGSYWIGGTVASPMNFYLNDTGSWEWDSDSGMKTDTPSCLGSTRHYRIYAPSSTDRFYNPTFGYYVFATTHQDHHEACDAWFDDSEGTEQDIANKMSGMGYSVQYDYAWFYNPESAVQGDHHWNNDGYATYINVP